MDLDEGVRSSSREAKDTSKLQHLQLADSQRRRWELDANDRQYSTGLMRGQLLGPLSQPDVG